MINNQNWDSIALQFKQDPQCHCQIIDNFWLPDIADKIASEFPMHDNTASWNANYNNFIEYKKGCNIWDRFPPTTYCALNFLNSAPFLQTISTVTGCDELYADPGLHGAGLHCHNTGGYLNLHQDYRIHPKLQLKRKFNLIVYMTPHWDKNWGGALEFRDASKQKIINQIDCLFNRAVIFDTTQDVWHGLPNPITCPEAIARNSLAVYYLTTPTLEELSGRKRALFTESDHQLGNAEVGQLIQQRSDEKLSTIIYNTYTND